VQYRLFASRRGSSFLNDRLPEFPHRSLEPGVLVALDFHQPVGNTRNVGQPTGYEAPQLTGASQLAPWTPAFTRKQQRT
jgi:hypothetical protein